MSLTLGSDSLLSAHLNKKEVCKILEQNINLMMDFRIV